MWIGIIGWIALNGLELNCSCERELCFLGHVPTNQLATVTIQITGTLSRVKINNPMLTPIHLFYPHFPHQTPSSVFSKSDSNGRRSGRCVEIGKHLNRVLVGDLETYNWQERLLFHFSFWVTSVNRHFSFSISSVNRVTQPHCLWKRMTAFWMTLICRTWLLWYLQEYPVSNNGTIGTGQ